MTTNNLAVCKKGLKTCVKPVRIFYNKIGAETEEQFEQLRKLGCDFIQGYLISKPITHKELEIFLEENKGLS